MQCTPLAAPRAALRTAVIGIGLLVLGLASAPAVAQSTGDVVDAVDQAMYFYYMDELLYTHPGDDRGYGPEHDLARDNILDHFGSLGLDAYLDPFQYQGDTYHNVVAVKLGSVYPEEHYIIGAHFDSVGNPGADDNASGTAGVMEIARVLADYEFESTIIFIAFDREEQGLHGSEAYAVEHRDDDIRGMISMDMIAYNTGADLVDLYGRSGSNALKQSLGQAVISYSGGLDAEIKGPLDASDHAPFEWEGFEAALIIEDWGNPYYHSENDHIEMPDYLDFEFATKVTRSVCGWLVDRAGLIVVVCPADVDDSGDVGFDDLLMVLSAWGECGECPEDVDGDGDVDFSDVLQVLSSWGPCA